MTKRKKVWDNLPKVPLYKPNLDAFYRFMYERHMIWVRRFSLKEPPPWTKDRILRDYKFTNVYRELDRGTIWYVEHVCASIRSRDDFQDLLWQTVMYRLLNRVQTFEKVGLINYDSWLDARKDWKKALQKLHETESVFTSAHLTLPTHEIGSNKIDKYIEVLDTTHKLMPKLVIEIEECTKLEYLFDILQQIPCVGDFISYEICCDLMLVEAVPFSENDWVNPGPGAKGGIKLIFPLSKTTEDFVVAMRKLQHTQEDHFKRLKLEFPYFHKDGNGKPKLLTLRSIEHSLCEFRKYCNVKEGMGKPRMKFKPQDWSNAQGQLPFRFPREEKSLEIV